MCCPLSLVCFSSSLREPLSSIEALEGGANRIEQFSN